MNIRYLEIMEAIAETGSFTGAAKKLFITQSAVSHAVAELEAKAGTALFERRPKGVAVTPCGRSLLEESRGILIASRNLDRRISHLEENTPIHVVSSITIASFVLPQILNQFRAVYPEQQIFVRVASAKAVLDILQRGDADVAFWEGAAPKGDFETITLGSYLLRAACSPGFSVSSQSATLRQLCGYPLLLREQGSAVRDTFDHMLVAANLKAEPVWESVNSLTLAKAAEAGMGITVLPEKLLLDSVEAGRLRFLQIEGIEMENQMLVLLHRNKYVTKPLQLLLENIKIGSIASVL
ncbi:DNA-binding transcriptional regulator YeiE [Faecalicatena orotica]|uniref:DNA-binding transcriptional LysR family regulator n=1 Tax=Faecalicatena orotica TaxID=1544 RepID=A0A2Y9BD17_9FIRM|nr:LysR family transcriptional regulator [Faecalicatena orotica]PWJ29821.1 DNA-binding transcriptional LysR family regulator [Faecalicatena orotica]SSA55546.1 DNA-binding transcriptional regulator, LysR family [Faecalicatena orotica]